MRTINKQSSWLKTAISLGFGIFTGAGFVALHFPVPMGEESFHLSQFGESIVLSLVMTLFWGLLCMVGTLCASFGATQRRWRHAWVIALIGSLALGVLVAVFLGYSGFTGEERDWFKTHDRFVLSEYLVATICGGLFYGGMATVVFAASASVLLLLSFITSKLWKKAQAFNARQQ